jgi:hypothetical protein
VFFVLIEYHIMDKVQNHGNPDNCILVLSPFVKSGTIIEVAVCYTAKKQSHGTDYGFFHSPCLLAFTFFPFHPVYAWFLPVKNSGC